MTRTCKPCNNKLGSHVEADLLDWLDNAITVPRFTATSARGARQLGRILLRTTPDGDLALIVDGKSHPDIRAMLETGGVELTGLIPDPNRYRLALLKHANLAAG
jgi:hypothetical protein